MKNHIGTICTEQCINRFLTLSCKYFFTIKYVNRYNYTNQHVKNFTDSIEDSDCQVRHQTVHLRHQISTQPICQHCRSFFQRIFQNSNCCTVFQLDRINLIQCIIDLFWQCQYHITDTAVEFRYQHI